MRLDKIMSCLLLFEIQAEFERSSETPRYFEAAKNPGKTRIKKEFKKGFQVSRLGFQVF
jgi:hypothetical protein